MRYNRPGDLMAVHSTRPDLVKRARGGDREAFDRLAQAHQGSLRALIATQLGPGLRGRLEIDDVLQETLLRAFLSIGQLKGETEAQFGSWLAGIACHTVADAARRLTAKKSDYRREVSIEAKAGASASGSSETALDPPSPATSPSRILRREERLDRLLEAIQTLSPDHRQVILLVLFERLSPKGVAERMDRSEKAVSMLLLRAMRALKDVFGDTSSLTLPRDAWADAGAGEGGNP